MKQNYVETENLIYQKKNFFVQFLLDAVTVIFGIIAIFIIGFTIIYDNAVVSGVSMQPTLNPLGGDKSDIVYINKLEKIYYGDIVVLEKNASIDINHVIKRVIGLPGDVIEIKQTSNGIFVFRNGEKLDEDYIFNTATGGDPNNFGMNTTLNNFIEFRRKVLSNPKNYDAVFDSHNRLVLQKNQVFVLGDNRGYSIDSSSEGPLSLNDVVGKVDFIVPYETAPFYYFLKHYTGIDLTWIK